MALCQISLNSYDYSSRALRFSPDGKFLAVGSTLVDPINGTEIKTLSESMLNSPTSVTSINFFSNPDTGQEYLLSGSSDGAITIWDIDSGKWIAKLISFDDDTWVVVDPEGRFDTNDLEEIKGLHWIMPDDPMRPLPIEIFMREYYEPRLLPRILTGEKFRPVKDLSKLNRVQPLVKITGIELEKGSIDSVSVTVEVARGRGELHREGKDLMLETEAYDLRLFRDGQMVDYVDDEIKIDQDTGKFTHTFHNIKLPHKQNISEISFSAYAFNADRIKSITDRKVLKLPEGIIPIKGKAYVITVGVNASQNPAWDLNFAANDARSLNSVLLGILGSTKNYSDIVQILLVSDYKKTDDTRIISEAFATKNNIEIIFDLLAGKPGPQKIVNLIPNADKIEKATPDDLVLISFSSHGDRGRDGNFYILPFDIGEGKGKTIPEEVLISRAISSGELSQWFKDIDAGETVVIVDACHAATMVEGKEFKPGPMGSRGLGQLAYDKGLRLLAATQAANNALEIKILKHGLLTYALINDGIEARHADFRPQDKTITMNEWLEYGVNRVPELHKGIVTGKIIKSGDGISRKGDTVLIEVGGTGTLEDEGIDEKVFQEKERDDFQQPSIFDFARKRDDLVIMKVE